MFSFTKMLIKKPLLSLEYILEKMHVKDMDDERYIRYIYYKVNDGDELNLDKPQTYGEKLNWMKLYDRNPLYTCLVDKYKIKEYVAEKIGQEYVIPLVKTSSGGVYNSFSEIDREELPNKFVLKTNHDCGGVAICTDKSKFDFDKVQEDFTDRINKDYSKNGREWPYKNVDRKIICEEYIENLSDHNYKFFVFGGEIKTLYVAPYREKTVDYFDPEYNHLDIETRLHGPADVAPLKPDCFDKMKEIAVKLAGDLPAVRVDLYEVDGKIYFGEMTFFHEAGFTPFIPDKWNDIFGSWINLNKE